MEEHRRTCEEEGRYVEAQMAKNRIAELKEQEQSRKMEELNFMHQSQREECEAAHIRQYQEFNEHWDRQLEAATKQDQKELLDLEDKHTMELEKNR